MNLAEVVKNIDSIDRQLIIFLADLTDKNSEVLLAYGEEGDGLRKNRDGKTYEYLSEIFLAKEVIDDFVTIHGRSPSIEEAVQEIYEYGINDR